MGYEEFYSDRHRDGNVVVALELETSRDEIAINDITSIHPKPDESVSTWIEDGLLLGFEKTKGREWLENSIRSNFGQPQVMATSSYLILYDTSSLSNVSKAVND